MSNTMLALMLILAIGWLKNTYLSIIDGIISLYQYPYDFNISGKLLFIKSNYSLLLPVYYL